MVHQISTNSMVHAKFEGYLQLGSHAVRRADQDGVLPALQIQPEERSKAPNAAQDIAIEGLLGEKLDPLLSAVATADVHTGVSVGDGFGFGLAAGSRFVRHFADFLRIGSWSAWFAGKLDSSSMQGGGFAPLNSRGDLVSPEVSPKDIANSEAQRRAS
jgi:hypothetical protein